MENNNLRIGGYSLAAGLILGALTVYNYAPRTEVQEVQIERIQNKLHTVTKIVERPDGSKETTTEVTDHSVQAVTSSRTEKTNVPLWLLGAGTGYSFERSAQTYNASLARRLIGPLYLQLQGSTEKSANLNLIMEF